MTALKVRLLFLINSLNPGGAERQLCELVKHLDPARFQVQVVVFYDPKDPGMAGFYEQVAALPGVTLTSLHKRRGPAGYGVALPRLLGLLLRFDPDIVHGYMDGNLPILLLGGLLRLRVVWGIRRSSLDQSKLDRLSRCLEGLSVRLSRFVDLTIFNSEAGLGSHAAMGMRARRMCVVPNGFDVERFRPEPALGQAQRGLWGIPEGVPVIGIVGRLDPVKDHPTFLRAAARVLRDWPAARFVCVGAGPEPYTQRLRELGADLGLGGQLLFAGNCAGMTQVYNAFSLLLLTSTDEGFPNVLGEAMACGVPCVTTRVGDAAALVGETGVVAAVGDDAAIAAGAGALLREAGPERARRALAARGRICERYSVEALARNTGNLLVSLMAAGAQAG